MQAQSSEDGTRAKHRGTRSSNRANLQLPWQTFGANDLRRTAFPRRTRLRAEGERGHPVNSQKADFACAHPTHVELGRDIEVGEEIEYRGIAETDNKAFKMRGAVTHVRDCGNVDVLLANGWAYADLPAWRLRWKTLLRTRV